MSRILFSYLAFALCTSASAQSLNSPNSEVKGYYPGMLISKDSYVRLKNCSQNHDYALLPSGKYGYEVMAELISIRKNTPFETPVSVGLHGEVEYDSAKNPTGNFLVRGLEFVKTGESCDITVEPSPSDQQMAVNTAPPIAEKVSLPLPVLLQTDKPNTESPETTGAQPQESVPVQEQDTAHTPQPDQYGITEEIISTKTYQKLD